MRIFLITFSLLLLFSSGWGFEKKSKTRKDGASRSETSLSGSFEKPANESNLSLNLRADGYESQFAKSDSLQVKIDYLLKYYINHSAYLRFNPIARLHSGHVQSVDGAEALDNRLSIQHAAAYYQWMRESYVSAGIFDQQEIFSTLLFDDKTAFLGGQAKQSMVKTPWTFSLLGQTVILNSRSSITDQNEKESSPLLNMVGLSSRWFTGEKNDVLLRANYFKFSQLPLSVSTTSVINGNTSTDFRISDTERAFKYEYYGLDSDLSFKRRVFKNIYLLGSGSFVQNQGAPAGLNQAYRAGGGAGATLLPNQDFELSAFTYRIESDSVLGAYGNTNMFITNHLGYELIASWKNVKQNYSVSFYYNDGRLVVENPSQSDSKFYFLRFEVFNVAI